MNRLLEPLMQPMHDRLTLLLNHVLGAEPQATSRLKAHSGRRLVFVAQGLELGFRVTPAGLLEAAQTAPGDPPADLTLRLTEMPPRELARHVASGARPRFDIQGDSAFAETVSWLVDNLRWDVEDDLARMLGDAPAHQLSQIARGAAQGLHSVVAQAGRLFDRAPGGRS